MVGVAHTGVAVETWWGVSFRPSTTMRVVIPGVTLTSLGVQAVLSSFFMSILAMERD